MELEIFIHKILRQICPNLGISKDAMFLMNVYIESIMKHIANEAGRLSRYNKKNKITEKEIEQAVLLLFPPGLLRDHSISEGTKACTRYNSSLI